MTGQSGPGSRRAGKSGVAGALRRFASRFALVDEERDRRREEVADVARETRAALDAATRPIAEELRRVRRENAAILRLIGEAGPDGPSDGAPRAAPSRPALFAELERGSRREVMARLEQYVERFRAGDPVVDLGCGRGEFLEAARKHSLATYGVDLDRDSVAEARSFGLDARQEDLFDHLSGVPDGSLGGVFSSQVVEHLPPERLTDLMERIARVLRPGGVVVIETPNPATFATHVHSFWRDPTHTRPVPDVALAFAARTAGLVVEDVLFTSPLPDEERLQPILQQPADPELKAVVDGFNTLTERLNDLLLGYQDYALVATKPIPEKGSGGG